MAVVGLATALLLGTFLFALFIIGRAFGLTVCAACVAFVGTWLALLALHSAGWRVDPVLVAALMGGSVVGISYFLQEKLPEDYQLFTFPFLASGFSVVYMLFGEYDTHALPLLGSLWGVFGFLFVLRTNAPVAGVARKLIECCRNW